MRDEEILALFDRRDEQAIVAVQAQYGAYCRKIASGLLPDPLDCEECLNDVWHRAWQTLPHQRPQQLKAWLAAVTRNTARSRWETQTAEKRGGGEAALVFEELSECVAGAGSPEEAVLAEDLAAEVNRFLRRLPVRDRDLFLRRYYFAESTEEIAARYKLREANVYVRLSRIRNKLRQHLMKEGYLK
jgi:RNA polymerase sigma factor, sigma-70 family